jgi:hypothetical protein
VTRIAAPVARTSLTDIRTTVGRATHIPTCSGILGMILAETPVVWVLRRPRNDVACA